MQSAISQIKPKVLLDFLYSNIKPDIIPVANSVLVVIVSENTMYILHESAIITEAVHIHAVQNKMNTKNKN